MKNMIAPTAPCGVGRLLTSRGADPAMRGQPYSTPSTWSEAERTLFINLLEAGLEQGGQKLIAEG